MRNTAFHVLRPRQLLWEGRFILEELQNCFLGSQLSSQRQLPSSSLSYAFLCKSQGSQGLISLGINYIQPPFWDGQESYWQDYFFFCPPTPKLWGETGIGWIWWSQTWGVKFPIIVLKPHVKVTLFGTMKYFYLWDWNWVSNFLKEQKKTDCSGSCSVRACLWSSLFKINVPMSQCTVKLAAFFFFSWRWEVFGVNKVIFHLIG